MNASERLTPALASDVVWITGARGFIGRRLARYLCDQGRVVCGVGHGHLPPELWAQAGLTHWLNSNLTAEALELLAANGGLPEQVFHLAGGSSVGASLQVPLEDFTRTTATTATLLEWLRNNAPLAKLVVASSAAVYGDTAGTAAGESRAPGPVSPYGYHKLMMEQLCQEYSRIFGLPTAIVRLFSVYGEGLRKQLLWDSAVKLDAAGTSVELGGTGDELRDWLQVDDAVSLLYRVAAQASEVAPVFNGGSGVGTTVREMVTLLAAALGSNKDIAFSGHTRAGDPRALVADTARIAAIGHACHVPLTVGVERYAAWFARQRPH
jgi:UDP-glucose 4-epimerase